MIMGVIIIIVVIALIMAWCLCAINVTTPEEDEAQMKFCEEYRRKHNK